MERNKEEEREHEQTKGRHRRLSPIRPLKLKSHDAFRRLRATPNSRSATPATLAFVLIPRNILSYILNNYYMAGRVAELLNVGAFSPKSKIKYRLRDIVADTL